MIGETKRDLTASRIWGKKVRARNGNCFHNALRVASRTKGKGTYVEGYAVSPHGLVVYHGWVALEDATILEPTPAWQRGDAVYFPVWQLSMKEATQRLRKQKGELPLDQLAGLGIISRHGAAAYRAAMIHAHGVDMTNFMMNGPSAETGS